MAKEWMRESGEPLFLCPHSSAISSDIHRAECRCKHLEIELLRYAVSRRAEQVARDQYPIDTPIWFPRTTHGDLPKTISVTVRRRLGVCLHVRSGFDRCRWLGCCWSSIPTLKCHDSHHRCRDPHARADSASPTDVACHAQAPLLKFEKKNRFNRVEPWRSKKLQAVRQNVRSFQSLRLMTQYPASNSNSNSYPQPR